MPPADDNALIALRDYYAEHQVLPSYTTIADLLGLKSKAWISALVSRLILQRFLAFTADKRLKPGARFFEHFVFDSVQAGLPNPANDNPPEAITLENFLIHRPSQTVLIRVKGDSMKDAGIHDGDLAVVERRYTANVGEIVVANLDNEFTLKYLDKDKASRFLRPANDDFAPIRSGFEIFGVMVGLVRKY
jgi:SOS-response transcriptional repressor LexA